MKISPSTLPASARGSGLSLSAWASASRSSTCSRLKSARLRKRFMENASCGDFRQCIAQAIHVTLVQDVGRQQPQDVRIRARAREDVLCQQRRLHLLGGTRSLEPQKK